MDGPSALEGWEEKHRHLKWKGRRGREERQKEEVEEEPPVSQRPTLGAAQHSGMAWGFPRKVPSRGPQVRTPAGAEPGDSAELSAFWATLATLEER